MKAELLYAGGGNAAIIFDSPREAEGFAWKLSKRVLERAPGLEIVIAHSAPFAWSQDLREQNDQLRRGRLAKKKRLRQAKPTPMLGLGVTAECESTGLVATHHTRGLEPDPRLVSGEIAAKLNVSDKATHRLTELAKKEIDLGDKFAFTSELDQLGRAGGEESYIGVVHIDGNDLGRLISDYTSSAGDNREYIERLRKFSNSVRQASRESLIAVLNYPPIVLVFNHFLKRVRFIWCPRPPAYIFLLRAILTPFQSRA